MTIGGKIIALSWAISLGNVGTLALQEQPFGPLTLITMAFSILALAGMVTMAQITIADQRRHIATLCMIHDEARQP